MAVLAREAVLIIAASSMGAAACVAPTPRNTPARSVPIVSGDSTRATSLSVRSYGARGDGVADDTAAIQAALDAAASAPDGIREVFVPAGTFVQSSPLTIKSGVSLRGAGRDAVLLTFSDIEQIVSERVRGQSIVGVTIRDLQVRDARVLDSAGITRRTKCQIRITNGIRTRLERLETATQPASESSPNTANLGGVCLETLGSDSFINALNDVWVRNGIIRIEGSDSQLAHGFVWSFANPVAIDVSGARNVRIEHMDIIPSPVNGGVYAGTRAYFITVADCFFDGSDRSITTGPGVNGAFQDLRVSGSNFWNGSASGIVLAAAESVSIMGNGFYNQNRAKAGHSDILIQPARGQTARGVLVEGNTFSNSVAAGGGTNGYCIEESDSVAGNGSVKLNVFRGNYRSTLGGAHYVRSISSAGRGALNAPERTIIGPNSNMDTFTSGTAIVTSGNREVLVPHGLGIVPFNHEIHVNPADVSIARSPGWYVLDADITETSFKIRLSSPAPITGIKFAWAVSLER